MKSIIKFLCVFTILAVATSCKKFLDKTPQGTQTEANFYLDPNQAILGVNAVYDVTTWDEGPNGASHNYEWMYGDVMSEDAEKGSTTGDIITITALKTWMADPANTPANSTYLNNFTGIFRANTVIKNLSVATWDATLKNRVLGEAYFLRGYFYFYLARLYGGMPLFDAPVLPSQFGTTPRADFGATMKFIEDDFKKAATLLPEKSGYAAADLGRATKGAANAYLARVIMYELGTINKNGHTWQDVYDITNTITTSGQYSLMANYAQIYEDEGANGSESIFELQCQASADAWGPIKTGTTNNIIQNNRSTWGWGFNNPTASLVNEFEANDPRLGCTVYKDGDIILGSKQVIDAASNATGYLSRKAAILKPPFDGKAAGQNIRKFRYADVLLMKAEAAANTGKEPEAVTILNQIRDRARTSTKSKGSIVGSMTYEPTGAPANTLPPIASSLTGAALKAAIKHERRVELGEEALHFWDQVRWGTLIPSLPASVQANATKHSITGGVNPVPVLPLPQTEVQSWGLAQNPGY